MEKFIDIYNGKENIGMTNTDCEFPNESIMELIMWNKEDDDALFGESGVMVLDYDPDLNRFKDEFGQVVDWIYRIIRPSQFKIFVERKSNYIVRDVTNSFLVELIYPGAEWD